MKFTELRKLAWPLLVRELNALGYKQEKRSSQSFDKYISEDWTLSIFVSPAGRYIPDHFQVNPLILIDYTKSITLFKEITGFEIEWPARIMRNIGYIMPQRKYLEWDYCTGCNMEVLTAELMDAIRAYAFPYMERMQNLHNFAEEYKNTGMAYLVYFYVPIIYFHLKEYQKAREYLDEKLKDCQEDPRFFRGAPLSYQELYDIVIPLLDKEA